MVYSRIMVKRQHSAHTHARACTCSSASRLHTRTRTRFAPRAAPRGDGSSCTLRRSGAEGCAGAGARGGVPRHRHAACPKSEILSEPSEPALSFSRFQDSHGFATSPFATHFFVYSRLLARAALTRICNGAGQTGGSNPPRGAALHAEAFGLLLHVLHVGKLQHETPAVMTQH